MSLLSDPSVDPTAEPSSAEPAEPDGVGSKTQPAKARSANKAATKKTATKKSAAKKSGANKSGAKKSAAKKSARKKSGAKKASAKKAAAKKGAAKKAADKTASNKKATPQDATTKDVSATDKSSLKAYTEESVPRGLSKEDRAALKALAVRSDARGLQQLIMHLALIILAGVGVAYAWATPWYPLAALGLGITLIFLFAPLHETVHRTAFESRWMNDALGYLAGFILILPPNYFRAFHLEHHRYTQIEGKDPELDGKRFTGVTGYLWILTGIPVWWFHASTLVKHAIGRFDEPYISGRQVVKVRREAAGYLGLYTGLAAASIWFARPEIVIYWLIPVALGQPFLRLYLMAEHGGCPLVPDMFKNTRTILTTPIVRFLAWNMPYHVEHHAFMAVPFHRLPEAHQRFKDRIEFLTPGYLSFHSKTLMQLLKG